MADAVVERRPATRFFCHRCLVEFEDVLQDYTCPYCEGGFIEQLDEAAEAIAISSEDYSDADMSNIDDVSNLDDSDEVQRVRSTPPMLNDLAFLMSGGRVRGTNPTAANGSSTSNAPNTGTARRPTLMEELVWMIGGGRPPAGAMTAGAPFVLVGTPGDYVFGGEGGGSSPAGPNFVLVGTLGDYVLGGDGLDAVVTQLLGQLEHSGPPPLPRERLASLPTEQVTEEQANANTACSVCWENFQLGETTSRLECEHVFHQTCITPWLQLHATCPICRRSLLSTEEASTAATTPATTTTTTTSSTTTSATPTTTTTIGEGQIRISPRVVIRRAAGRHPGVFRRFQTQWDSFNDTSTSSSSGSSITTGGIWAPQNRSSSSTGSNSSVNNDRDRQYNTDMDCD